MKPKKLSAKVIKKTQCPSCMDSGQDNLAVYSDGSSYCFGCQVFNGTKETTPTQHPDLVQGTCNDLVSRGIHKSTCEFFDYQVGKNDKEEYIHIANYKNDYGTTVAQKIRTKDKQMYITGNTKELPLYGRWLYNANPNVYVTIVEGEIDCLSVAQVRGLQYPVLSVPAGAHSAKKALEENLDYLSKFKYVILAFDNDEAGRAAMEDCTDLFEYGRVRICSWTAKDPNDLLVQGREHEIGDCLLRAKAITPKNIVTVSDILDKVLKQPKHGKAYPWNSLTEITYGFRSGEIHIVVGANGIGKTQFIQEIVFHFLKDDMNIGLFSFEQSPESTIQRLVGSRVGKKLHIPSEDWNNDEIREVALEFDERIFLYNHTHAISIDDIKNYIRYLNKVKGVQLIIIDNLKGLRKGHAESRGYLQDCMLEFQALAREIGITFILLSHVAKDKYNYQAYVSTSPKSREDLDLSAEEVTRRIKKPGMEWESGRMPSKENVEGESAVCDLADFVFALARNTVSEDPIARITTKVKCLKSRLDGSKTGRIFDLIYTDSGALVEPGTNHSLFANRESPY